MRSDDDPFAASDRVTGAILERRGARDTMAPHFRCPEPDPSDGPPVPPLDAYASEARGVSGTPDIWPAPLDLAALAEREPEPPRHIVPGWLPAGEVTLFAGHGGSGKSSIALHLTACIATGTPWAGLEVMRRPAVYVSAEDGADVLHWRIRRVADHLRQPLTDMTHRLRLIDASGQDAELMIDAQYGEPVLTPAFHALRELIPPGAVVVLDGSSDLYGASEIVRRHVRRFVRSLRQLTDREGAVLLLAHIDKAAARSRSDGDRYSGSTAWHNSVRARWDLLRGDSDAELRLQLAKANHAAAGAEIRLRWDAAAHLFVPEPAPVSGGVVGAIRDRVEREALLAALRECHSVGNSVPAATTGQRTALHVLRQQEKWPASLSLDSAASRRRAWAHIERLRADGAIREVKIRSHGHSVRALVPSSEEERECANAK